MKFSRFCLAVLLLPAATIAPAANPPNWGQRKVVPFPALQQGFANPDMIYAPFVFWFWDEPLDPG